MMYHSANNKQNRQSQYELWIRMPTSVS